MPPSPASSLPHHYHLQLSMMVGYCVRSRAPGPLKRPPVHATNCRDIVVYFSRESGNVSDVHVVMMSAREVLSCRLLTVTVFLIRGSLPRGPGLPGSTRRPRELSSPPPSLSWVITTTTISPSYISVTTSNTLTTTTTTVTKIGDRHQKISDLR